MSVILIRPGDVVGKDPADIKVYKFDWDTDNLATGVIINNSNWTITERQPIAVWDATKAYVMGDRVVSGGMIYTALVAHTNQLPPNLTYWMAIKPNVPLTKDSESILVATNRSTQVRLMGGTLGQVYEVANTIVTNETPAQTKEKSFNVLIENE